MLKRILELITAFALLLGSASAETAAEQDMDIHTIEQKDYPIYLFDAETKEERDFPLYFADGTADLPFVDLADWGEALNKIFAMQEGYEGYQVTVTVADELAETVVLERENGSIMACDFTNGSIVFSDYAAFQQDSSGFYFNLGSVSSADPEQAELLRVTASRERHGNSTLLKLKESYGIPMIAQDGKYLLPLQTLSFLTLSKINSAAFFNQEALIISKISWIQSPTRQLVNALYNAGVLTQELWLEAGEQTETYQERVAYVLDIINQTEEGRQAVETYTDQLQKTISALYFAGPETKRSTALAAYGYSELCMELDHSYGLKEAHGIERFTDFFMQTDLAQRLFDPDAAKADSAIGEMTDYWFDDGHSGFGCSSYLTGGHIESSWEDGFSVMWSGNQYYMIGPIRDKYPDAALPYYEVGDTAYITFDGFTIDPSIETFSQYYTLDARDALPDDTFGLLIRAHRQITRENSPIENVVIDLSMNGGGAAPAAVFTLCWFLGDAQISVVDPITGAESTEVYQADVDLDHRFDESDSVSHLNLYCLISSQSFSCGNLVPWAFKEDGRVTLLGKTSGGGSCVVRQMATAWGSTYQISGNKRISFVKNGSYYDVDKGVEPDCFIRSYDVFYDREALTAYIHTLH